MVKDYPMKKVGIITIHNSYSFGGSLQSFALWKYIETLGCDCEIIDLLRPEHTQYIESLKYPVWNMEPPRHLWLHIMWRKTKHLRKFLHIGKFLVLSPAAERRQRKYCRFNATVKMSRSYKKIRELYKNPPEYDYYITGSDQVWNPRNGIPVEPYFLTFVRSGKKVAYAASIGLSELPDIYHDSYKKWLSSYDDISVREALCSDFVSKLLNKNIPVVLDPTMLFNRSFWNEISVRPAYKHYILVYSLTGQKELIEYAMKVGRKLGRDVVVVNFSYPGCISAEDAGIDETLGLFQSADIIYTDSFHGTVFSLLFGIEFYVWIALPERQSRIRELLKICEQEFRLLPKDLEHHVYRGRNPVDYKMIDKKLSPFREFSISYLKKILEAQ